MTEIPITKPLKMFHEHLAINERTILSAKFGDGKTFFLNKFKEDYKDKYYFITLYPVNYSVAENADVFEYIKRDILLQLANDGKLNSIDLNATIDSIFNWNNLKEVINFLFTFVPEGEILKTLIKKAESFKKEYDQKKKNFGNYNVFFESQKGGIYENDGYTKLIESALQQIKNDSTNQRTVLIIEDLDRIDPAHLFRILNVFGAHFDCKFRKDTCYTSNKFGFSNIVTVFDYDITEHIFYHFYGTKASYQGYINKFKMRQPFKYSINNLAKEYLYSFFSKKCILPPNTLTRHTASSIYEYIEKLSVRDISHILFEIEKQIFETIIPSSNKNISFSSLCPLTIFITLLLRIGISRDNIKQYLIDNIEETLLLNFLGSFLLLDAWFCEQSSVSYGEWSYNITKEQEKGIITSFKVMKTYNEPNTINKFTRVKGAIDNAIQQALRYVND